MPLIDERASSASQPPQNDPKPSDSMSKQQQDAYEAYVAAMAQKADGKLFLNHDERHAEIVIAQLFKSAEHEVKILTGCLKDEVYGGDRIREAAVSFACNHPDGVVRILSEQPIGQSRFLDAMRRVTLPGNLIVIEADSDVEGSVHFTVADGKHFRYEEDVSKCEAVVAFGRIEFGQRLSSLFDRMVRLTGPRNAESSNHVLGAG